MARRDLYIMPLIVLLTAAAIVLPGEWLLRTFYPNDEHDRCVTYGDPLAFHAHPNCVARIRVPESPWINITYNDCGFREPASCLSRPSGSLRLAIIGSSIAAGYLVPYPQTIAARTQAGLERRCDRPVDVQNLGSEGNLGSKLVASAHAASALNPDAMAFVVSPTDLQLYPVGGWKSAERQGPAAGIGETTEDHSSPVVRAVTAPGNLMRRIKVWVSSSRLFYMASYSLLRSDANFVPMYVASGQNGSFMKGPLSSDWASRLVTFGQDLAQTAAIARERRIPLILLYVPNRAAAAIAMNPRLGGSGDPYLLQRQVSRIAAAAGVTFADATRDLPAGESSSELYYAMNGHINGKGHAVLARTLVDTLVSPSMPGPFRRCNAKAPRALAMVASPRR